jgi:hypothetical protein
MGDLYTNCAPVPCRVHIIWHYDPGHAKYLGRWILVLKLLV